MVDSDQETEVSQNGVGLQGPYNIVRLEGRISDNAPIKVVHMWFDFHSATSGCPEGQGVEMEDYLMEQLQMDILGTLDFFIEATETMLKQNDRPPNDNDIYLQKMRIFSAICSKGNSQRALAKIRAHFMDVRDKLNLDYVKPPECETECRNITTYETLRAYAVSDQVQGSITRNLELVRLMIQTLKEGAPLVLPPTEVITTEPWYAPRASPESVVQLLTKINNRYDHPSVRLRLEPWFAQVIRLLEISQDDLIGLQKLIEGIRAADRDVGSKFFLDKNTREGYGLHVPEGTVNNLIYQVLTYVDRIHEARAICAALITDIYFVRRITDKDQITNVLVYAGGHHIQNQMEILIKGFGFRVTHINYSPIPDIKILNQKLQESHRGEYIELTEPLDPWNHQCSSLAGFPKGFQ